MHSRRDRNLKDHFEDTQPEEMQPTVRALDHVSNATNNYIHQLGIQREEHFPCRVRDAR